MVEFCTSCGASLPKGDLTFEKGESFTSHDYVCPSCNQLANPTSNSEPDPLEPEEGRDFVIRDGELSNE